MKVLPRNAIELSYSYLDLLAFLIPAIKFIEFDVIGRLFGPELLSLIVLPFLIVRRVRLLEEPLLKTILMLGIAWLAGQILTDLVRDTNFEDYTRGWAKIGFFLTSFTAIYLLIYGSRRRIVLFALGATVGNLLSFKFAPNIFAEEEPWKFGYGGATTTILILTATVIAGRFKMKMLGLTIILLVAALNIYMGSRGTAGICFLSVILHVWANKMFRRQEIPPKRIKPFFVFVVGLFFIISVGAALKIYGYAAEEGVLGLDAKDKYELQAGSGLGLGPFNVLISGRSELLVSSKAIIDSPLIGHGSWAKDMDYVIAYFELLRTAGLEPSPEMLYNNLIPSHSYFFGAWVEGGILGGIFWLWIIFQVYRAIIRLSVTDDPILLFLAFTIITFLWDILFSPFAEHARLTAAFDLAVVLWILEYRGMNAVSRLNRARANSLMSNVKFLKS